MALPLIRSLTIALSLSALLVPQARAQAEDFGAAWGPPRAAVADLSAPDTVVFTGDELVRRGFRSLGDALAFELGVLRTRSGRGVRYAALGVPAGLVLTVDGVPRIIDGERALLDVDDMLPLHDVERVEIVRGPATALSGAGALTGVVRVFLKKPGVSGAALRGGGSAFVDEATVGGGEKELVGEGTLRDGDLGGRAFVRLRSGPPHLWRVENAPTRFENIGSATLPVSAITATVNAGDDDAVLARTAAQVSVFLAEVSYARTREHTPLSSFSYGFVGDNPQLGTREQLRARVGAESFVGPIHVEASVGAGRHTSVAQIPLFPARGAFEAGGQLDLRSVALFGQGLLRVNVPLWESHRVLFAAFGDVTALTQRSSSTDPRTGDPSRARTSLDDDVGGASIATEYQGDFPWGLHATAGVALEWRDAFPIVVTPRLGLAWDVLDDLRLRAGYSEGVRAPDRFDLHAIGAAVVDGRVLKVADNDLLRPEHVRMLDAGVGYQPSADLRFSSRAFALRHEDALASDEQGGVLVPVNLAPRVVVGGELMTSVAPVRDMLRVDGGVSLARTVDGADLAADAVQATLGLSSSPAPGVSVGGRGRAKHLLGAAAVSPNAAWVDVYASYDPLPALGVVFAVDNLFDGNERTLEDQALPFTPPAAYPSAGRAIRLSVEGRF